jgi:hypothetical protein
MPERAPRDAIQVPACACLRESYRGARDVGGSMRVKRSRIFALGVPTSNRDVRRALPASIGRSKNARRVR